MYTARCICSIYGTVGCNSVKIDGTGIVFAGNGAGGFYILKDDGKIYLFEYFDIGEELYAESLAEYFKKM